jgi:hypothetical protein
MHACLNIQICEWTYGSVSVSALVPAGPFGAPPEPGTPIW